ncbi:MAG: P-II family nitrogen regulator [Actinobacteria bacterium]|nr:P-II family nitrogen regulator [Actinomycetota bacterium]MCA1700450.1 P-II family nitrogen regulator [Actinomycetota bacterium]
MKLIVASLPNDAFEPVRTELLDLGVLRITISEVHRSDPLSVMTLHYRGAALHTDLRSELRLECVADDDQSLAVVNVLRGHASTRWGFGGRVAVLDLEELHQASEDHIIPDDPRLDMAVH